MDEAAMYDAFAEEYAQHAATGPYNALYDRPAVLDLCGEVSGLRVLDAACGPGLYAQALHQRGADVVGFDISERLIELARERLGDQVELRVHDLAEPLHWLAADSVDLAVLALSINYVDDRVALLRELRRVLRPEGVLVVSTTHPMADWLRLGGSYFEVAPVRSSLRPDHDWPVRAWRRPLSSVCAEFHEAGFAIERLVEPRPHPDMESSDAEAYARLCHAPAFIAFRLRPSCEI